MWRIYRGCLILLCLGMTLSGQTVDQIDPMVKFTSSRLSIMVSQIGYAVEGLRTAFLFVRNKVDGDAVTEFRIVDSSGQNILFSGTPHYAGTWVQGHFWKLDFSSLNQTGVFRITTAPDLVSNAFPVMEMQQLFMDRFYEGMIFQQMDARKKTDNMGGFIDCGNDIRETNSHVTQLTGILNMFERHSGLFDDTQRTRIKGIMDHFAEFLLQQQQGNGLILGGYWEGSQITMGKWPNHLRGVYGLLRLAGYYECSGNNQQSQKMIDAASKGLDYARAHLGLQEKANFIAMMQLNESLYHVKTGDSQSLLKATQLADILYERQLKPGEATERGIYGLFRQSGNNLSRMNYHVPGNNNGEFWGIPLQGLIMLYQMYPNNLKAQQWKTTIANFVEGFIKIGCGMSSFGLIPNGEYSGVRWFSELFHGMNMTYGIMADAMVEYGIFLNDPLLFSLAEAQLLWIGGLNTGANYPNAPVPISFIVGSGYQWLADGYGAFPGISGSIVNGLSATSQFSYSMPSGPEMPLYLCNESWISHTGGWLSGTSALCAVQRRTAPPHITSEPQDLTVMEGEEAIFEVKASGGSGNKYAWFKNGLLQPDQTNPVFRIVSSQFSDNQSRYYCIVSNDSGSATSRTAILTVRADTVAPTIVCASAIGSSQQLTVVFSEPLESNSAQNVLNYSISNNIQIFSATLSQNGMSVVLGISALTAGIPYTLSVSNVFDRASSSNTIAPNSTVQFEFFPELPNHDFETGDLTGWTIVSGTAFSAADVTNLNTASANGIGSGESFNQHGSYHLWGYLAGQDEQVGVLKSSHFTIGGSIDFLIAGGNNIGKLYLSLVAASDERILLKATGTDSETYRRITWDTTPYLGTEAYILVVDSATGDWGHVNIDDVNIYPLNVRVTADKDIPNSYLNNMIVVGNARARTIHVYCRIKPSALRR